MSGCDCQKNIKKPEPTVGDVKKLTGDRPFMVIVAATTAVIFFCLTVVGVGQHNALLTSTSLLYFLSFFLFIGLKNLYNKWLVSIGKKNIEDSIKDGWS